MPQRTIHVIFAFDLLSLDNIGPQELSNLLRMLDSVLCSFFSGAQVRVLSELRSNRFLCGDEDGSITWQVSGC